VARLRAPSPLQAVAEPAHGDDVTGIRRIGLDLRPQAAHVYVDEAPVAEVPVPPDAIEQHLAREHTARVRAEFAKEAELGLREMDFASGERDLALFGNDLEVAKDEFLMAGLARPRPAKQRSDARREFLGGERLREVVVGTGLEPGDNIVGVGARRDHHDRHVARAPQRAAELEAVDARKHDVDEDDVGGRAAERFDGILAARRFFDGPPFVFEGHLDRRTNALVVLDGKNAGSHPAMLPYGRPLHARTTDRGPDSLIVGS